MFDALLRQAVSGLLARNLSLTEEAAGKASQNASIQLLRKICALALDPSVEDAQALLGSKAVSQETAARGLASYTSELGSMQLSRAGELTARLTGATQAHDLARATKRYLRSMDFAVASVSEPLRESAGVYSVTAVQSLCGVPVFESALTFTYRNSALSRVDGTFYPTGETVRVSESACISCADALVCLLSSRDSLGWVGSEILSCEQGYVHSETASSAMRFVPVWRIETDAGTFHVSGITREVRQLVS